MKLDCVNARDVTKFSSAFLVVLPLMAHNHALAAEQSIGAVAAFSGPVMIQRAGGNLAATKGMPLSSSDALQTGAGGVVQVKFNDGSSFTLYENSNIRIDKYRATSKVARGVSETAFDILQGKLKFFVNPRKEKKNETQFRSKTALMGIRGTSGIIDVASSGETQLVVLTGLVEVKNPKFPNMSIAVAPNFSTRVNPGAAPQPPRPVSPENLKTLLPSVSSDAGFTEDGPQTSGPEQKQGGPQTPASEQKQDEQKNNRPEGSPESSREGNPDGAGTLKKDKEEKPKDGEKSSGKSKPLFAPGGAVINRTESSTQVLNSTNTQTQKSSDRDSKSPTGTNARAQGVQQQPVAVPPIGASGVLENVTSKVTSTIERTQKTVQESAIPQRTVPTPQPQTNQKIKVKINLPSQ